MTPRTPPPPPPSQAQALAPALVGLLQPAWPASARARRERGRLLVLLPGASLWAESPQTRPQNPLLRSLPPPHTHRPHSRRPRWGWRRRGGEAGVADAGVGPGGAAGLRAITHLVLEFLLQLFFELVVAHARASRGAACDDHPVGQRGTLARSLPGRNGCSTPDDAHQGGAATVQPTTTSAIQTQKTSAYGPCSGSTSTIFSLPRREGQWQPSACDWRSAGTGRRLEPSEYTAEG